MTIREVEQRTGMERASIRYYEQEGLLTPRRGENGYRDYAEEDVDTLLRVRFLRSLGFSLEQIRAFQRGELTLHQAMPDHIQALEEERRRKEQAVRICQAMQEDGAEYATLDWQKYQHLPEPSGQPAPPIQPPKNDILPHTPPYPWRRYLARYLDVVFSGALLMCLIALGRLLGGYDPVLTRGGLKTFTQWVPPLLALLIEPLLLSRLGTTPGKAILGLRVETLEGGRLSFQAAWTRAWQVAWYGQGLFIPVFSLIRQIISYRRCKQSEMLPWEEDSVLCVRPMKARRGILYAAAFVLLILATVVAEQLCALPPCRGEVTTAQFARNFNALAYYYGVEDASLDAEGQWQGGAREEERLGTFVIDLGARFDIDIDYELREDNTIRAMTWRCSFDSTNKRTVGLPINELTIAALSCAGAAGGVSIDGNDRIIRFCRVNAKDNGLVSFGEYLPRDVLTVNGFSVSFQSSGGEHFLVSDRGMGVFMQENADEPFVLALQVVQTPADALQCPEPAQTTAPDRTADPEASLKRSDLNDKRDHGTRS